MLWRMHAAQNKRMDHMQRDLTHRMDTVTAELRASLETVATELRQGQQILTESLSKLDSRISRLEGCSSHARGWKPVLHIQNYRRLRN